MHPRKKGPRSGGVDWRRGFWKVGTDEQDSEARNTYVGEKGEDVQGQGKIFPLAGSSRK